MLTHAGWWCQVRLDILVDDYSDEAARAAHSNWQDQMSKSVTNLRKRLGPDRTAEALRGLECGDFRYFLHWLPC
jgi:hypothetical protein